MQFSPWVCAWQSCLPSRSQWGGYFGLEAPSAPPWTKAPIWNVFLNRLLRLGGKIIPFWVNSEWKTKRRPYFEDKWWMDWTLFRVKRPGFANVSKLSLRVTVKDLAAAPFVWLRLCIELQLSICFELCPRGEKQCLARCTLYLLRPKTKAALCFFTLTNQLMIKIFKICKMCKCQAMYQNQIINLSGTHEYQFIIARE